MVCRFSYPGIPGSTTAAYIYHAAKGSLLVTVILAAELCLERSINSVLLYLDSIFGLCSHTKY